MTTRHLALFLLGLSAASTSALGQDAPSAIVRKVGFEQKPGAKLPLDLPFRDENGRLVRLGEYFGKKPVILTMVYYRCPMLCSKELDALTRTLKILSPQPGRDFEVVTVSFSPDEPPSLASAKKASYIKALGKPEAASGWHFLTGSSASIAALTDAVGFLYTYNPTTNLYAHDAGIVITTPDGTISRYMSGLDYPAKVLQKVLTQASAGTVGKVITWVKLLCYDYDPSTGRYTLAIMRTLRAFGVLTVILLASSITAMILRDRLRNRPPILVNPPTM